MSQGKRARAQFLGSPAVVAPGQRRPDGPPLRQQIVLIFCKTTVLSPCAPCMNKPGTVPCRLMDCTVPPNSRPALDRQPTPSPALLRWTSARNPRKSLVRPSWCRRRPGTRARRDRGTHLFTSEKPREGTEICLHSIRSVIT